MQFQNFCHVKHAEGHIKLEKHSTGSVNRVNFEQYLTTKLSTLLPQ